jgi:hypothetical protein
MLPVNELVVHWSSVGVPHSYRLRYLVLLAKFRKRVLSLWKYMTFYNESIIKLLIPLEIALQELSNECWANSVLTHWLQKSPVVVTVNITSPEITRWFQVIPMKQHAKRALLHDVVALAFIQTNAKHSHTHAHACTHAAHTRTSLFLCQRNTISKLQKKII